MNYYGSQNALNMNRRTLSKTDLTAGGALQYSRSERVHSGGNGFDPFMDSYNYSSSKSSGGSRVATGMSGPALTALHQKAVILQSQCQEYLKKADFALQSGGPAGDAERYMAMAKETIEQLRSCAMDLRQMGQPNENVVRTVEICKDQLKGVHMALTGSMRRRSTRVSSSDEMSRSFQDAMAWIAQKKRLIETSQWGDDSAAIEQNLLSHQMFHSSIQRSSEVDRARDELVKLGDKGNLHALDQEWDSLQKLSHQRSQQLMEVQQILQEMSSEIMWVNDREEDELMFDWGDKNINTYIPKKQESYSKLMSALEEKEKHLNKVKTRVDNLLKNQHPAAEKIEAYRDTLQTQWSWLLQITKCIDVHLKENAAYSQFFKDANETYKGLQSEHESVRKKFTCDKNSPLADLLDLLKGLEREKEKIMDHKRQVQRVVNKSKSIVRLKPRNPEEKSGQVIVKALCDFKQDQKVICKGDEAILNDNSHRSKWEVTGPGGLHMEVPSVCLIVPPPNPLTVSLANKNEQYYEAIMTIWNQLYINVKSLIAWQYCLMDIQRIRSLTIEMLAQMRPEEYRQIIKSLETRYEEFKIASMDSEMFADEDKRNFETEFTGAQNYYDQLVVQLPTYIVQQGHIEVQQAEPRQVFFIQQQSDEETYRLEEERRLEEECRLEEERRRLESKRKSEVIKKETLKVVKAENKKRSVVTSRSLSELHALRLRLEALETSLSLHVHVCFGDDAVHDCGMKITQLEKLQRDLDLTQQEYMNLKERILREVDGMKDSDKAQFLRSEISVITQRLSSLGGSSSALLQRLQALREMLESVARAEDIVKVHEARLAEKETTSLSPAEVESYMQTLKELQSELEQKKSALSSMEAELTNATHWSDQEGGAWHRCDLMLGRYSEQVGLLSDRWRRIQNQISTRLQDLQSYLPQLQRYKLSSDSFSSWIDETRKRQLSLQGTKIETPQALMEHMDHQKVLNSEIKAKRETLDSILKENQSCVSSVKDYESDLTSYTSGLETLLNIPIKRTMLKSPTMDLNQEATELQTRYMELLTQSSDYYKFLGELLKNMEELKMRNTRIDLLEEELRLLKDGMNDRNATNRSLEETIARYKLQLSQSQDQLLSMEEVKRTSALQTSATKDSFDSNQKEMSDLRDQVERLTYMLEEEKRKRRLAEDRYTQQQNEYESVLRKRQSELETVSWSKVELEKDFGGKDREIEQLRRRLADEADRAKDLQMEISKVRNKCCGEITHLKLSYQAQIRSSRSEVERLEALREEDSSKHRQQRDRMDLDRKDKEVELQRLRGSLTQVEEQMSVAMEEVKVQRSLVAEGGCRMRELESQLEALTCQKDEEMRQHQEEIAGLVKTVQEQKEQLAFVSHNLEEETRRRKTADEGLVVLEQTLTQVNLQLTNSSAVVTHLGDRQEELQKVQFQLEREKKERSRVEQNLSRFQGRLKDLQAVRDALESQMENVRRTNQEEVSRRRQLEMQLEVAMHQKHPQREEKHLQKLKRNLEQESIQRVAHLSAELQSTQQQLQQEQSRVREVEQHLQILQKTLEEKNRILNETTEQLRVHVDGQEQQTSGQDQLSSQINTLHLQLQASERSNVDCRYLVAELSSERERLLVEAENFQQKASEISTSMKSLQSQYNNVVSERDALLLKLQTSDRDIDRVQRLEEELTRIKFSLESEISSKQRLHADNERIQKDLDYWKGQCNSKETLVQQCDMDKERLEREKSSLESEIQRLMRKLQELERMYKDKLSMLETELSEVTVVRTTMESELKRVKELPTLDDSAIYLDGVRKAVTASQLFECGLLDKPTFSQLVKGHKSVPDVSMEKKVYLKGTGPIAGVIVENPTGQGSSMGPFNKLTLTEAKKQNLISEDCVDLLLDAQAATGHIIDPRTNQKMTVDEACIQGVVDEEDRRRLLAAEEAAVGYNRPGVSKPLSVAQATKHGMVNKPMAMRLLQAQESVGGILDPVLSVFFPKDKAISREIIDEDTCRALNQKPELYLDPETETGATYMALKKRCKVDPHTGLLLFPVSQKQDLSQIIFDGVRKPVTAQQLLDCGVLDKQTCKDLEKGKKTVPIVSADISVNLKGKGPISGVIAGMKGKMSFSDAKKLCVIPADAADLLLDAQAATGHIIDPTNNLKLTVDEACDRGVVDMQDRERLLSAEAAAVGIRHPDSAKLLSVFEAMKNNLIDDKSALRLLQAQNSTGGILDPNLSVFLPKETAIRRNLLDEKLSRILNQNPGCYLDPDSDSIISYGDLKKRTKTESHTGLMLLSTIERRDPSKIIFDGVRKQVSAQQLLDCGVLEKSTFNKLVKGEKTVDEVALDKKVNLKGTGPIVGIASNQGILSLTDAKKHNVLISDSIDYLLEAQVATGYVIDPKTNDKLTVEEACARGVVDIKDRERLLVAEGAVVGYKDPNGTKPLSVFEAMKKGIVDPRTALRLLQAQESAGGILDPILSVFLPKELAIRRNIFDENTYLALSQRPTYYIDPEPEHDISYGALKQRCKTQTHTGVLLLPISEWETEKQRTGFDPSTLVFQGVRKPITAQQLLDCGVLNKPMFDQLVNGERTVPEVSALLRSFLTGTGAIAGVAAGPLKKMSFTEAKRHNKMLPDCANRLLEAQAATGYIIDPKNNQRLTVKEAMAKRVVDKQDESRLFAAEAAVIGYKDPKSTKLLSAGQAMNKGLIDKDTVLQILQAQEAVGGILDPNLSVFLPRDIAMNRNIIDADLYQSLSRCPKCFLDPDTKQETSYEDVRGKCTPDPSTGLLLIPVTEQSATVQGLRGPVSVTDLVSANLLDQSDLEKLTKGRLTSQDIETRLCSYLGGSSCIAGVFDEANNKVIAFYQAMKDGLLKPGTTLELLEAQAASGFIIDPVDNLYLTVGDAYSRRVFGADFKDSLLSAERAVTGYPLPGTDRVISLFQAMEKGLVETGHGTRLLEAQLASGGIIDPEHSHRIDVNTAYQKGYLDEKMNKILTQGGNDSKGFFDPNTEENLTYPELKKRCIRDKNTGLLLLPIVDKKSQASSQKSTQRRRRVVIVDPETNKEMNIRQAYDKGYIDHETFLELTEQECEWEEITTTAPDGSKQFVIIDRQSGNEYNITDMIEKGVLDRSKHDQYRSGVITLTQFADIITSTVIEGSAYGSSKAGSFSSVTSSTQRSSGTNIQPYSSTEVSRPISPTFTKMTTTKTTITERSTNLDTLNLPMQTSGMSITVTSPFESLGEKAAIGAIFNTEVLEKISISEAHNRGLLDAITAQRLLEAQACTGGIINPLDGQRLSIQEASSLGIIPDDMVAKLKPAQKAYMGFEDVKTRKKLSVAEALKEMWLPYEAGQRFMEYQVATGGLYDPEAGCRRSLEDALRKNWLDERTANNLQDFSHHSKNMTCPKSKLRISYNEALDNSMLEDGTGVRMLQASTTSSKGISSPYNVSSAPGSSHGSRSGSNRGSRRSSFDSDSSRFIQSSRTSFSSRSNF